MIQHLVITAMGTDRPGIGNEVIRLVTQAGCNIIDSRIALFGNEFTLIMLVSGNMHNITHIETTLPLLGQQHDFITVMKRTSPHILQNQTYAIEVFVGSEDQIGLTEKFTHFFAERRIGINSLSANTISKSKFNLEHDQFHIAITASVNSSCNLMQLQEEFNKQCATLDVKGSLHFIKNNQ